MELTRRSTSLGWARGADVPFGMLLAVITLLPTLVFFAGLSSSLALGSVLAATLVSLVATRAPTWNSGHLLSPGAAIAWVVWAVVVHAVAAGSFQPFDTTRASASLLPLVFVLYGGISFSRVLAVSRGSDVHRGIWGCFLMLCGLSVLPSLGINLLSGLGSKAYEKPVFPFTEPSHLALMLVPMMLYCCASSTGLRRLTALLLGVMVAVLVENLTMMVGCVLVLYVCIRGIALPLAALALSAAASQLDLEYYTKRLDFSGEFQNLSNIVYVQGWQLIGESLERSGNWGLGFQQLGVRGSDTPAAQLVYTLIGGDYSNLLDGGFTFSKLVSEFGVFGFVAVAIFMRCAYRALRAVRTAAKDPRNVTPSALFANAMIIAYTLELFIRGIGYFTGSAILLVGSLWLITSRAPVKTSERS